jgi:DNA-binding IclR family transcriptional regulator
MAQDKGSQNLGTLEKCVKILTLFSEAAPAWQVQEIADALQLPRSTAYRYIAALRSNGLVESDPENGGYRLGLKILDLAASMQRTSLHDLALPLMERISRELGETVILCGLRENAGFCMEKVEGHHALRVSYELGDTYPLHAAATGKAILAFLPAEEQRRVIDAVGLPKLTDRTITEASALRKELAKIRNVGYAESYGESIVGTRGLAAPVFSRIGYVAASIGISAPEHRAEGANRKRMIELLLAAAEALTQELRPAVGKNT